MIGMISPVSRSMPMGNVSSIYNYRLVQRAQRQAMPEAPVTPVRPAPPVYSEAGGRVTLPWQDTVPGTVLPQAYPAEQAARMRVQYPGDNVVDFPGSKGMSVNLDPANLVMVAGDDPVKAVHNLSKYIVHTHAKDGVMLKKTDPQIVYDFFAEGGIGDLRLEDYFLEVPLGEGKVDFPAYLGALKEIGFGGYLTIEREVGENPVQDIGKAVTFLRNLI